jgi:outer membrane immunogenic protein
MSARAIFLPALLVAVVLSALPVRAADLPAAAPPPAQVIPVQPTWTGFYAGLNAGYGWANTSATLPGFTGSSNLDGFVGGGQLGYNWQSGNLLLGIEGDFQGSTQSRSDSGTVGGVFFTVDQDLPWLATIRGRIGYANGPWLVYATGGAAWVNYKLSATALGTTVSSDATRAAWTVGGGVEWMFVPRWSAKLEYLYVDTDSVSVTLFGVPFTGRAKDNIVRAGVNYHF